MLFIATFTSDTHVNACDVVWGEEISRQHDVLVGGYYLKLIAMTNFPPSAVNLPRCSNLLIASRLVPYQKKGELHNCPKKLGLEMENISLCGFLQHMFMRFIIPGCSLADCTTTTKTITYSNDEATTHLMLSDKHFSRSRRSHHDFLFPLSFLHHLFVGCFFMVMWDGASLEPTPEPCCDPVTTHAVYTDGKVVFSPKFHQICQCAVDVSTETHPFLGKK